MRSSAQSTAMSEYTLARLEWRAQEDVSPRAISREPAESVAQSGWMLPEGQRMRCAAPECGAHSPFWKKAVRPVFEGQWACGKDCLRVLVGAEVQRQMRRMGVALSAGHRHRIPLGLVLLNRGLITHAQLRMALEAQRTTGQERIGYWLEQLCGVSQESVTRALAAQWNRPVLSAEGFAADRMALTMPGCLRRQVRALPLRIAAGKILYIAFEQQLHAAAVRAVERMAGLRVESGVLAQDAATRIDAELRGATAAACVEERIHGASDLCAQVVSVLRRTQPVASRLVNFEGAWWLRVWLERGSVGPYGTLPRTGEDVMDYIFRL